MNRRACHAGVPLGYHSGMFARRVIRIVLLVVVAATASACRAGDPWVEVGGERFYVEIAADETTRSRGLMFRESLADNAGMLFIFPREAPRAFWMRNTRIPLDILYLDSQLRIVSMSLDTPPCRNRQGRCPNYPSGAPARYVLELNAGTAERLGVGRGDRIRVGNVPGVESAASS